MVFLPNWVGDVVMATPALRSLREHFRGSSIVYAGRKAAVDTLTGCPWADSFMTLNRPRGLARLTDFVRTARRLRREKAQLTILMPNSFRSALLARASRAGRLVGYSRDGRGWLLHTRLAPPRDEHGFVPSPMIDYYNALVAACGAPATSRKMELPLLDSDELAADVLLRRYRADPARPIVMLNPGAAFGVTKLWSAKRYAQLADELVRRRGAQILVHAAPSEKELAEKVAAGMTSRPLINFAREGSSLGLLKSLLRRCRLLVTNDTGARHIGAAVGTAVVTIFGSTDPAWTTLDYPLERTVRLEMPCSPCQKPMCSQPAGPQYRQCLTAVSVDMVLAPALELLDVPEGRQ